MFSNAAKTQQSKSMHDQLLDIIKSVLKKHGVGLEGESSHVKLDESLQQQDWLPEATTVGKGESLTLWACLAKDLTCNKKDHDALIQFLRTLGEPAVYFKSSPETWEKILGSRDGQTVKVVKTRS